MQLLEADEVAYVGNYPILAGFDEPVFVELGDIGVEDIGLLGDDAEQSLKLPSLVDVAAAVDGGQELIETIRRGAHWVISLRMRESG